MAKLTFEITMSLDGFVAGPNPTLEQPLGEGGDRLHQWAYGLRSWRESHGLEGGEENPDSGGGATTRRSGYPSSSSPTTPASR